MCREAADESKSWKAVTILSLRMEQVDEATTKCKDSQRSNAKSLQWSKEFTSINLLMQVAWPAPLQRPQ